jgi:lon-related putative ATP-dependent protease
MITEVPLEKLRMVCEPGMLECTSSQEMQGLETIIGQARAVKALRFGLGIKERGFNIYVSGVPGTGRTTAVERFLKEVADAKPVPDDWCYLYNFREPHQPHALRLPPGRAKQLQADMKDLVAGATQAIRSVFEGEDYASHRREASQTFERQRDELFSQLGERAQAEGFLIQATPVGLVTVPMKKGKPYTEEQFAALSQEERDTILKKRDELQAEIEAAIRQGKRLEKGAGEDLRKLDQDVARYALGHLVDELKEKYHDLPEVLSYLDQVQDDMVENQSQFRAEPDEQAANPLRAMVPQDDAFRKYEVNVLVDNAELKGAPVITEFNPTFGNLFGRIEQQAFFGALVTDFTLIREGALHRANGGYLVLPVDELLRNPFAWDGLKRGLGNGMIAIEDISERYGFVTTKSLKPEPVPMDVKVVLIGQPDLYYLLRAYDEQFSELFKVKADFDTRMERTEENIRDYTAFVCTVCEAEGLKHLDDGALAKIVEHGSRLVEDQDKLSTRFGEISDVIREASFYATEEGTSLVTATHVQKAIEERFYRSSLIQERIQEMIERGSILINVEGTSVGQVNGLSVIGLGDISFGQPSRITASIALGREGVIDIEREAKLGGPIHTKGVMILAGYLSEKYAQNRPLSLSARLVFEQSYGGVEGDSASSTELYSLLSSLSGLPIKQGIAVTGSVNQKGEVQAIGGVNEKIEGFYAVCKAKGLSGEQGVMIPASNVQNLMLKEEVVEAVKAGKFHVWQVKTVDEGIEILTGVPAGQRQEDGRFEEGTVGHQVDQRLEELAETMKDFAEGHEKHGVEKNRESR